MGKPERVRRSKLDRTRPHRNWAATVAAGPPVEPGVGPDVRNANRVVEEYRQAGQAAARLFSGPFGVVSGNGQPQDVAQRMARAGSDLMTFWLQLMGQAAGSTPPVPPTVATDAPAAPQTVAAATPRVTMDVDAPGAASVTFDLRPGVRTSGVCAGRLLHRDPAVPPLTGIEVNGADDGQEVTIRLRVKSGQPAGVYSGVLLDAEASLPIGTIAVELQPPARRAGRRRRQ